VCKIENGEVAMNAKRKMTGGTIILYLGPEAPAGWESNWVKTMPGKQWFTMMRFYGPEQPFFDK
jgi:hypothetical protein